MKKKTDKARLQKLNKKGKSKEIYFDFFFRTNQTSTLLQTHSGDTVHLIH